jgi:hypothetical protein
MEKQLNKNEIEHSEEIFYPSFLFKEIVTMMLIFILVAIILALVFPVLISTFKIFPRKT